MSVFTRRLAAGVGASLLTALAGLAFTATPASAAGVDLAVTLNAGTVAVGSESKAFVAKVTNVGDAKATGFDLAIQVDETDVPVNFDLPDELDEFCENDGPGKAICEFGNVLIPGDSLEIPIFVAPTSDETGNAGTIQVAVLSTEDGNDSNNKASATVTVSPPGVDIVVWAEDVVAGRDDDTEEAKRIAPGGTGDLYFAVANDGSVTALGIEFTLQLPEHVTFEETLAGCDVSSDNRKISCSFPDFEFEPAHYFDETLTVKVAATAPGSAVLTGSIAGRGLGIADEVPVEAARALATTDAPAWLATKADFDPTEVDNKDNTDEFAVFVGAAAGGGGGLPVTGPKAVVIGMVGLGVLTVGVVALVGARRRRVVLVTPSE